MTQTSTYTPTFMEKLLGRNYKWWFLTTYKFKARVIYLPSYFFWIISEILTLVFIVTIWSVSNRDDTAEILEYILLGNIFFALTNFVCAWVINKKVNEGKITSNLILPCSFFGQLLANAVAGSILYAFSVLTILIPLAFVYRSFLSFNWQILYLFLLWPIASLLRFLLEYLLGLTAFWTKENNGLIQSYSVTLPFLAGSLIPFPLLNSNFAVLNFLPFSFTFYHPMQIYLGNYDNVQTGWTLLGGVIWCIILYFLAKLIFKLGLKRNESVGL